MHWFRSFVLIAALLTLLAACSSSETPTPEPEQAPEQSEQQAPEQEQQAAPEQQKPQMTQMVPCKIVNVDDSACTNELSKALADILLAGGESETTAKQVGVAISTGIQREPLDKRNGFTMTSPETGQHYSFLFQNVSGEAHLVLFQKKDGGDNNEYELITSRPMPSCECSK